MMGSEATWTPHVAMSADRVTFRADEAVAVSPRGCLRAEGLPFYRGKAGNGACMRIVTGQGCQLEEHLAIDGLPAVGLGGAGASTSSARHQRLLQEIGGEILRGQKHVFMLGLHPRLTQKARRLGPQP